MPTLINYHIKMVKEHAIELTSHLYQIAKDIKILANDDKISSELNANREKLLEVAANLECMAGSAASLQEELTDRLGYKRWPESMSDLKSSS